MIMNDAHYHLMVNHLPVAGLLIGILVLLAGLIFKNRAIKRTALGIFIFSTLASVAAFYTGEGAEEVVEDLAGLSETLIHTHEEYAELFYTLSLILGGLSLITFILEYRKVRFSRYLIILCLLTAMADGVLAAVVGASGGELRHTEIRGDIRIIPL